MIKYSCVYRPALFSFVLFEHLNYVPFLSTTRLFFEYSNDRAALIARDFESTFWGHLYSFSHKISEVSNVYSIQHLNMHIAPIWSWFAFSKLFQRLVLNKCWMDCSIQWNFEEKSVGLIHSSQNTGVFIADRVAPSSHSIYHFEHWVVEWPILQDQFILSREVAALLQFHRIRLRRYWLCIEILFKAST